MSEQPTEPIDLGTLRDDGEELLPYLTEDEDEVQDEVSLGRLRGFFHRDDGAVTIPSYVRTGSSAVEWMRKQHYNGSSNWRGKCLQCVRLAHNVASHYYDADDAWYYNTTKHRNMNPPRGVPFFYGIGLHGHVVEAIGDGTCWSSDALRIGRVDKVSLGSLARNWGARPLGWTETINQVRVYREGVILDASTIQYATAHKKAYVHGVYLKKIVAAAAGKSAVKMNLKTNVLGAPFRQNAKFVQQHAGFTHRDGLLGVQSLRYACTIAKSKAMVVA